MQMHSDMQRNHTYWQSIIYSNRSILVAPIAPKMSVAEDLEPLIFSIADNHTPWHVTHITISF